MLTQYYDQYEHGSGRGFCTNVWTHTTHTHTQRQPAGGAGY